MEGGPVCVRCKATSSLMWHKSEDGAILCLDCHCQEKSTTTNGSSSKANSETSSQNGQQGENSTNNITGRRTRSKEKASKSKQVKGGERQKGGGSHSQGFTSRGQQKGRRTVTKQHKPMKSPKAQPTIVTSDSIIHKGTTYEVGDIVSVLDVDGGVYYALIRGFLQDQYAEKYAILTWLLPTHPNPSHFDPSIFVLGPEEDSPRMMENLQFVCHSPQSRHFPASFFHDLEQAEQWRGAHTTS